MLRPKVIREPAQHRLLRRNLDAVLAHEPNAIAPHLGRANARCGIRQHEPAHAMRGVLAQPDAREAADRDAAHSGLVRARAVEHRERVAAEPLDREIAGRRGGLPVPSHVVANEAESVHERGQLLVPQRVAGAERVQEKHRRRVVATVDRIPDPCAIVLDFRHARALSRCVLRHGGRPGECSRVAIRAREAVVRRRRPNASYCWRTR